MKVVPLHCVVIAIGSGDISSHYAGFQTHEVITAAKIVQDLVGTGERTGLDDIVRSEVQRKMLVKLRLGERVIIDVEMTRSQRTALANAARAVGVPVFYLITEEVDRDTARGDGVAEVLDCRNDALTPVPPQTEIDFDYLKSRYAGVTVIGDVHGMHQSFQTALSWARNRNHFPVFVGDIIDYGPGTLEVADEVYRLVMRGEGKFILGNHERKIMRWIDGHRVKLSDGNRTTTAALQQVGETQKNRWVGRFRGLYQNSRLIDSLANVIFVHGGLHPSYWKNEFSDVVENTAFFGEVDGSRSQPGRPIRSYHWVESIPSERMVVVGHDRRAASPFVQTNAANGKAIFLDTGSGKGGVLSSADFRFDTGGLRLENFNIY